VRRKKNTVKKYILVLPLNPQRTQRVSHPSALRDLGGEQTNAKFQRCIRKETEKFLNNINKKIFYYVIFLGKEK
jgi:hypothetical protein